MSAVRVDDRLAGAEGIAGGTIIWSTTRSSMTDRPEAQFGAEPYLEHGYVRSTIKLPAFLFPTAEDDAERGAFNDERSRAGLVVRHNLCVQIWKALAASSQSGRAQVL